MTEHVRVEDLEGGVRLVTLDRPEKKNALTGAMYDAMRGALEGADASEAVGAVVFAGQPGAFSAGNDIADFVTRWGAAYDHMLVLDADSLLTGDCVVRLAAAMEADPDAGIVQSLPLIINRNTLFARLQQLFASSFPEARGRVSRLENGPSVGQPIQYRVAARDLATAAPLAEKVAALLLADPNARSVTDDLGEPLKTMRIELDQDKVRALGLSTETVAQSLQAAIGGAVATTFRDGDRSLDVTMRLARAERTDLSRVYNLPIATAEGAVPLSQIGRIRPNAEPSILYWRGGQPTITVSADAEGVEPTEVMKRLAPKLDDLRATLPDGASIVVGGTQEQSAISRQATLAAVPMSIFIIVLLLMIQLQDVRRMLVVLATGPLALIGVAVAGCLWVRRRARMRPQRYHAVGQYVLDPGAGAGRVPLRSPPRSPERDVEMEPFALGDDEDGDAHHPGK